MYPEITLAGDCLLADKRGSGCVVCMAPVELGKVGVRGRVKIGIAKADVRFIVG